MSNKQGSLPRAQARRGALYLVFGYSFQGGDAEMYCDAERQWEPENYDDYSRKVFLESVAHRREIDAAIERHSKNWKLSRISRVSVSILRVAICEMMFIEDVDTPIAINEAVELAKQFEGEDGASFVNGVLGGVARESSHD